MPTRTSDTKIICMLFSFVRYFAIHACENELRSVNCDHAIPWSFLRKFGPRIRRVSRPFDVAASTDQT